MIENINTYNCHCFALKHNRNRKAIKGLKNICLRRARIDIYSFYMIAKGFIEIFSRFSKSSRLLKLQVLLSIYIYIIMFKVKNSPIEKKLKR